MAFDINGIKSALRFGGARPTMFKVQIFNPINPGSDQLMEMMVRAASIPDSTLGTIPVMYFGRAIKFAGDRQFSPWDVTIMNDEDFPIRDKIEQWSNAINALERNIRDLPTSEASLYKSTAKVTQLSKTGQPVREYTFYGLWPSQISPIGLDWGAQDSIEEFNVVFEYDHYEVSGGTTGNAGGA